MHHEVRKTEDKAREDAALRTRNRIRKKSPSTRTKKEHKNKNNSLKSTLRNHQEVTGRRRMTEDKTKKDAALRARKRIRKISLSMNETGTQE